MCLAVPGKIIKLKQNRGTVEISNLQCEIYTHLVPDVKVGQYVLVHAGCAIEILNEKEAFKALELLKEIAENEVRG